MVKYFAHFDRKILPLDDLIWKFVQGHFPPLLFIYKSSNPFYFNFNKTSESSNEKQHLVPKECAFGEVWTCGHLFGSEKSEMKEARDSAAVSWGQEKGNLNACLWPTTGRITPQLIYTESKRFTRSPCALLPQDGFIMWFFCGFIFKFYFKC